ncbi:hypothetical protein WJX77_008613 [Trebouxia sp. C0004]
MDSPEKDAKAAKKYLTKYNVDIQANWSDQETVHRAIALRDQKTAGRALTRVGLPRQKANQQYKSKVPQTSIEEQPTATAIA